VRGCAINNFKLKSGGGERRIVFARAAAAPLIANSSSTSIKREGQKRAAPRSMEINCQWGEESLAKHVVIADKYGKKIKRLPEG
jgi:hypothetical protein